MNSFAYRRATTSAQALDAVKAPHTSFLAGGTNLIDLMKYRVEQPTELVECRLARWCETVTWRIIR